MQTKSELRKARLDAWLAAATPEELEAYRVRRRESSRKAYHKHKDARREYARAYMQHKREVDKDSVNDYKNKQYAVLKSDPDRYATHSAKRQEYRRVNRQAISLRNREKYCNEDEIARAKRQISAYRVKLRNAFGMTFEQYEALEAQQKGLCAICNKPEDELSHKAKSVRRLSVDHDHKSGRVRGLLCRACNCGIGLLNDDPAILTNAIEYIKHHATTNVSNTGAGGP